MHLRASWRRQCRSPARAVATAGSFCTARCSDTSHASRTKTLSCWNDRVDPWLPLHCSCTFWPLKLTVFCPSVHHIRIRHQFVQLLCFYIDCMMREGFLRCELRARVVRRFFCAVNGALLSIYHCLFGDRTWQRVQTRIHATAFALHSPSSHASGAALDRLALQHSDDTNNLQVVHSATFITSIYTAKTAVSVQDSHT